MSHMALYRVWRPITFDDVVEQRHIVETLKNSVKSGKVNHAYLFCGTRGTGKTTLAKILARAINCLSPVDGNPCNQCEICRGILDGSIIDVIEIDAASNNGVDDVRQIKEAVMYVPAVARYKVYIVDEVHMLSTGAFNALLKTLEEPPESVVFILATTEPHKLPATILSRCQRFDFRRISVKGIAGRLEEIAKKAGVNCEDAALALIARLAAGGMRDAISLLDQCIASFGTTITRNDVIEVSGYSSQDVVDRLAGAIAGKDIPEALRLIDRALADGRDLVPLCAQLVEWFRNLMLYQTGGEALRLIESDEDGLKLLSGAGSSMSLDETIAVIKELSEAESRIKWSENQRTTMEAAMVRLCTRNVQDTDLSLRFSLLESRIADLEKKLSAIPGDTLPEGRVPPAKEAAAEPYVDTAEPYDRPDSAEAMDMDTPANGREDMVRAGGLEVRDWPDVIDAVRVAGEMKVFAFLQGTRCIMEDERTAVVVVAESQKKGMLNRSESIEVIKAAILATLGLDVKVKIKESAEVEPHRGGEGADPVLERLKRFADENDIRLDIRE
jgi:DNA polymerase-3 subunit gamma/tau